MFVSFFVDFVDRRSRKKKAESSFAAFAFLPCVMPKSVSVDDFVTSHTYANLMAWQQYSPKTWNDSEICKAHMLQMQVVHAGAETQTVEVAIGGSQEDDVDKDSAKG